MHRILERALCSGLFFVIVGAMPARGQLNPSTSPSSKQIIGVKFNILAEDFRDGLLNKLGDVEDDVSTGIADLTNKVKQLKFVKWMPVGTADQSPTLIVSLEGEDFGDFGENIWLRFSMRTDKKTVAFEELETLLYAPVSNQPTGDRKRLKEDVMRIVRAKLGLPLPDKVPTPHPQQPDRTPDFVNQILTFLRLEVPLAHDAEIPQRSRNLVVTPLRQQDIWAREGSGIEIRFQATEGNETANATLRVRTAGSGPTSLADRVYGTADNLEFNMRSRSEWTDWILPVFDRRIPGTLGVFMADYTWIHDATKNGHQQRP